MRIKDFTRLNGRFRSLLRNQDGSVATIFAVALVPVVIAAGIGVDISRASSSRSNLQDALDATALALAHLPVNTPQAAVDAKALTWLNANLSDTNIQGVKITTTLTQGQIVLNADAKIRTTLTAIAGVQEVPIAVHSTVKWGSGKVEVALVLDNTGSMAGTKLTRLKEAADDLVEALESSVAGSDPTALKISLVPFSMTVRLSSNSTQLGNYRSASWMRGDMPSGYATRDLFTNDNSVTDFDGVNRFSLFDNVSQAWAGCVEMRSPPFDVQDTPPSTGNSKTQFLPYFAPDEPRSGAIDKPGYGDYDIDNDYLPDEKDEEAADDAGHNSKFDRWSYIQGWSGKYDQTIDLQHLNAGRGPNRGCSMASILRLTSNTTNVKNRIKAMNAVGNTNIPIGLMWGWHTLSPNLPFADGVAYSTKDVTKIIVLLTDGDNVMSTYDNPNASTYSSLGYAWQKRMSNVDENASDTARTNAMDGRMTTLCNNIKGADITIYAVRIDMEGTSAPTALKNCASSADKFYDIDSSALAEAFKTIAGSIGKLRIAK